MDFLEDNPQHRELLRLLLLSAELLALPEQFARLVQSVDRLSVSLEKLSADFYTFAEKTDQRLSTIENFAEKTDQRLDTIESDVAPPSRSKSAASTPG